MVPAAMALSGLGAMAAARDQFLALTRLQARFLDRIRGIATIVMLGRGEDEAKAQQNAADALRRGTMRVLRLAFLSSAALDLAAALALVLIAVRYGAAWQDGTPASAGAALAVLLLIPEFFSPLRAFAATYQDLLHATAAAEALASVPPMPDQPRPRPTAGDLCQRSLQSTRALLTGQRTGKAHPVARTPLPQPCNTARG